MRPPEDPCEMCADLWWHRPPCERCGDEADERPEDAEADCGETEEATP